MLLRRQKIADGLICVWAMCVSLMSAQVFFKQIFGITSWPVSLSLNIAIMVSMYLYSKYIIDTYSQFQKKDFLHYLPSFLILLYILATLPNSGNRYQVRNNLFLFVFSQYFVISSIVYVYLSFMNILKFKRQRQDAYTYDREQLKLHWLIFVILFQTTYIILTIAIATFSQMGISFHISEIVLSILNLIMVYALNIGGIMQEQLVIADSNNNASSLRLLPTLERDKQKNAASDQLMASSAKKLLSYIEENKAWRDCELTISKLSKATGISKRLITKILNEYLGNNFYTLINNYRIEDVKSMMLDKAHENQTFLAIAYECGFNSKTAFYTSFKKATGMTPSEYKGSK
jgi:AraC-like DNA-binding protein